ncbi:MAG: hypothetical protein JF615_03795 [Asticcacaulis sp.]|nr:hypothetical protein [Asticcacaulis sp.]
MAETRAVAGRRHGTYHNAWVAHNGNTYTSHWSGSSDSDYVGGGDKHHVHTSYYDPEFVPLTVSDEYCDVRVHVGADRRVQSVEFEGNCDSYRKKAEDLHRAVLMPASSSSSSVAGASRGG